MKLSVVIPTYKPQDIRPLLTALVNQQDKDFELVLVENGSDKKMLADHLHGYDFSCSPVFIHEKTPGLNRARNLGVKASKGSHIVLIDDDCLPGTDWIGAIKRSHKAYPSAGVIGGRVLLSLEHPHPFWLNPEMRRSLAELEYGEETKALERWQYLVGANLSFTRIIFDDVCGFNENLGLSGDDKIKRVNDEAEFIFKASLRGMPGAIYAGEAVVKHTIPPDRTSFDYLLTRWFGQGVSDIEYDLLQGGTKKAVRSLYSNVFHSHWHLESIRAYAAGLTGDEYEEFFWRGMLIRAVYLYGMRERLISVSPVYGNVSIIGSIEHIAFKRGSRLSDIQADDSGYAEKQKLLQRILYNSQPTISPFTRVTLISGLVSHELDLKIYPVEMEQTAA